MAEFIKAGQPAVVLETVESKENPTTGSILNPENIVKGKDYVASVDLSQLAKAELAVQHPEIDGYPKSKKRSK